MTFLLKEMSLLTYVRLISLSLSSLKLLQGISPEFDLALTWPLRRSTVITRFSPITPSSMSPRIPNATRVPPSKVGLWFFYIKTSPLLSMSFLSFIFCSFLNLRFPFSSSLSFPVLDHLPIAIFSFYNPLSYMPYTFSFRTAFIEFYTSDDLNIVGIIGPGCTACATSLAGVTKVFYYSFISYGAEGNISLFCRTHFDILFISGADKS